MSIPIEPSMGVSMGSSSHSGWALVLWVVIKSNSKTKEIFNRLFIYLFKILFYKLFKDGLLFVITFGVKNLRRCFRRNGNKFIIRNVL